jgi:O-antigen ligase/Tfp pilus assembly protein PilF
MKKIIFILFAVLFFFVPLVLWPFTSEVFEFNKMVLVYILTTLIAGVWAVKCIIEKKFIFRRTLLDIPLLVFFGTQLISTFLSIDFYTSVFGYYSRFNGGITSTICYLLLYWAFVSNFDKDKALKLIKIWLASAVLVSIYGVLEHFGIDKDIWVQDVQSRVFSSLGQPNWLAAWIIAFIPITWSLFETNSKKKNFWIYLLQSTLFFVVLLFTKSRSGLLGFAVASGIYWGFVLIKNFKQNIKPFLIFNGLYFIFALIIGTQWTPSLNSIISTSTNNQMATVPQGTALETGGTESSAIRKIVWKGALQVWLHYPIFGTGVETFAYSYYQFRPTEHNLTSEWNFIYNKAHNEFLNFAANTGTMGLIAYLTLIGFSIFQIYKLESSKLENLKFALIAGFVSILATNFFGFSVVPIQLQFFIFPAIAATLVNSDQQLAISKQKTSNFQKMLILAILIATGYLLITISNYWYADILYNKGKTYNAVPRPDLGIATLTQAIKLVPSQALYYGELANSYTSVAMAYNQASDASSASQFTDLAIASIQKAVELSPSNVNIRRVEFGTYVKLSTINERYLIPARNSLIEAIKLAPTDAKLYYNLGVANANLGDYQNAAEDLKRAVELKPDYGDARLQYAALLVHLNKNNEAKDQLNYILTKIDPTNSIARQALENIK